MTEEHDLDNSRIKIASALEAYSIALKEHYALISKIEDPIKRGQLLQELIDETFKQSMSFNELFEER